MVLVLILLVIGMVCVAAYYDPRLGVGIVLAGYVVLPFAAQITILGVHVCTVLTVAVGCTRLLIPQQQLPVRVRTILAAIPRGAVGLLAIFIVGSLASELLSGTSPGVALSFWLNFILAPVLVFLMCCDLAERYASFYRFVALGYILAACAQSVLAYLISRDLVVQPFLDRFMTRFWWRIVDESNRQMGTIDHPLDLGLFIATAIPLLALLRRTWLTYVALVLMMVGIALTQSRIGLLGAAVGVIFLILTSSATLGRRVFLGLGVAAAYVFFDALGVFNAIFGRIADDSGSADARRSAWAVILPDLSRFFPFGEGIQRVKPFVASQYGLNTSPESALLGYLIGFGAILATCFFAGLLWIVMRRLLVDRSLNPGMVAVLIALVSIQLFSSISTGGTVTAYVLWTCMFFAIAYTDTNGSASQRVAIGISGSEGPVTAGAATDGRAGPSRRGAN
ncbi:O-antigen ligase family protein [Gordonia terrae]|uniref:O-antigen ligase family protein n=1 Tax=Gordonia terrae TaxID=2055 RepID=UPI003F6A7EE4